MTDQPLSRVDRIRLLLESHHDYLPGPKISRYGEQAAMSTDPMIHQAVQERVDEQQDLMRDNLRELERLQRLSVPDSLEDPLIRRRDAHYASGSYAALDRGLATLRDVDRYSWIVLQRTYVDGLKVCTIDLLLDAIQALSPHLPAELRLPEYVADRNGETLHVRIRIYAQEHPSASQSKIARKFRVNQSTVSRALAVLKGAAA